MVDNPAGVESSAAVGSTLRPGVLARFGQTWTPIDLQPRTVVVVQAHSDDFVGGCGGLARHLVNLGAAVRLITLFRSGRDDRELALRKAEIEATGALLNIETGPPLADSVDAEWAIGALIDRFLADDPDLILTPFNVSEVERHPEHVLAGWLVTAAAVTTGMTGRRWRYGNVTCFPLSLIARGDRALVMGPNEVSLRADLYRLHNSQLNRRPNPAWMDLPGDDEAADYLMLTNRRSQYQLQALGSEVDVGAIEGTELFQACRPIESRPSSGG